MPNPIEQLKDEYDTIAKYLTDNNQPSLLSDLNKNYRKILLLSAGGYFENRVTSILSEFVRMKSQDDNRIISFLKKQAISGRYHTLFEWGQQDNVDGAGKNANKFFKLFGDEFYSVIEPELKKNQRDTEEESAKKQKIMDSIQAFIEIGHLRNILVHSNFAAYNYDQKTTDEIFKLFQTAEPFLDYMTEKLV